MQHFEKLLSPSEYDRQLEPNCPIDSETKKRKMVRCRREYIFPISLTAK